MKKNIFLFTCAALLIIATERCKKSDTNSNSTGGDPKMYTMTATINGVPYNGVGCSAVINGTELSISEESTKPYIFLTVNGYKGANTYPIGLPTIEDPVPNKAVFDSTALSSPAQAYSGSITITGISPNVSGTFNFMATSTYLDTTNQQYNYVTDTISVNNGSFTAQLLP